MFRRATAALAALATLSGCAEGDGSQDTAQSENPAGSQIKTSGSTEAMTVEPATAEPGDVISLHFAAPLAQEVRGVGYQLHAWTGDSWQLRYYLSASAGGGVWSIASEGMAWPDIGVSGPGPDRLTVPVPAEPGIYQVCTANAATKSCDLLEVSD